MYLYRCHWGHPLLWTCALDCDRKCASSGSSSKVNNSLPGRHFSFLTFCLQPPISGFFPFSCGTSRLQNLRRLLLTECARLFTIASLFKMPRLVRRRPLWERITSNLNPMDFLLWLSEELETRDWDSKLVGTQLGVVMNILFLLARANVGLTSSTDDDIFGDETKIGWFSYVVSIALQGIATCRAF